MGIHLDGAEVLPVRIARLLTAAREVANRSYNPYSGNLVGAAVETSSGGQFVGCFMENLSYGMTICAEPSAIMAANAAGHRDIVTIAIVGGDPKNEQAGGPCTPCGRCRQILWEVASINHRDVEVYGANLLLEKVLVTSAVELMPYPFGPPL